MHARITSYCDFQTIRLEIEYRYKQVLSDSFARTAPLLKGFSLCQNFFGRPQENYLGLRTGQVVFQWLQAICMISQCALWASKIQSRDESGQSRLYILFTQRNVHVQIAVQIAVERGTSFL